MFEITSYKRLPMLHTRKIFRVCFRSCVREDSWANINDVDRSDYIRLSSSQNRRDRRCVIRYLCLSTKRGRPHRVFSQYRSDLIERICRRRDDFLCFTDRISSKPFAVVSTRFLLLSISPFASVVIFAANYIWRYILRAFRQTSKTDQQLPSPHYIYGAS